MFVEHFTSANYLLSPYFVMVGLTLSHAIGVYFYLVFPTLIGVRAWVLEPDCLEPNPNLVTSAFWDLPLHSFNLSFLLCKVSIKIPIPWFDEN